LEPDPKGGETLQRKGGPMAEQLGVTGTNKKKGRCGVGRPLEDRKHAKEKKLRLREKKDAREKCLGY